MRHQTSQRVLVLAPTAADAELSRTLLGEANMVCHVCGGVDELAREFVAGAGAILLTDTALIEEKFESLIEVIEAQPPWSDIPILMLCESGADSSAASWAMEVLRNITVLERPIRLTGLISSLRAALRARNRQYELRALLEAQQRGEQQLRLVIDSLPDVVTYVDRDTRYRLFNQTLCDWFKLPPESVLGQKAVEIMGEEAFEIARPKIERALAGERVKFEAEIPYKHCGIRNVEVHYSPNVLDDGTVDGFVALIHDISERKRTDRIMGLHNAIVESSDDAIISKDLDGTILTWNRGAEQLFGYTAAEVIGRSVAVIIPNERLPEETVILNRIRAGDHVEHFETVRVSKAGRKIDISLMISPIRDADGRVIGASKVARDISEQKNIERTLRWQGERLRLLWEAATVLLTSEDPNAMLRRLFEKISSHMSLDVYFNFMLNETGDSLRLVSCAGIPDEEAERIARLELGQAVCGNVALRRRPIVATRIQQSDDPMVQLVKGYGIRSYACNPLIAEGRLLGTLSFASRQRDQFEPDELEFLETICQYVTVAYERVRLVQQLRDTDRRKDEFLATLAHELRNPLAPMRTGLEVMKIAGDDRKVIDEVRATMERQMQQMVRLIDDLLDVSRITRGKLQLRKERVELFKIIKNAVETARPLIEASGHQLDISLAASPISLDADPIRLSQVFANLLNNAAKYMEPGGKIWLSVKQNDGEVAISVRDAGIGISSEALPTVFELFTQVDRSLEKSHGGLGIGLTLVKRLVEMHGGSVEARSEGVGKGSEFLVRLTVAPSVNVTPQSPTSIGSHGRANFRILVADDNRDAAESLGMMLRLMGNEVRVVHDGAQAVEEAEQFRPDVILLDVGMPRMNGYDAAQHIRAQRWGRDVVLAALTGWGQDEDKRRAMEAGFDRHFTKPIDAEHLRHFLSGIRGGSGNSFRTTVAGQR